MQKQSLSTHFTAIAQRITLCFITPSRKPRKWFLAIIAIYFLFTIICGLIIPPYATDFAASQLSSALQTKCTIQKISFNPFTLTLSADAIAIPYPNDNSPFLQVEKITLAPGFSSITRLAPALGYLTITRPTVHASISANGQLSTAQFLTTSSSEEEDSPPFPFIINNLEIVDGNITFEDNIHQTTHTVENLNIIVPFASTRLQDKTQNIVPTLSATLDGNPIFLEGRTTPFADDLRTEFRLRFGELPLHIIQPYITPYSTLTLESGQLTAETVLHFTKEDDSMDIGFSGSLYINDLDIHAPKEGSVFQLRYGSIEMEHYLMELQEITLSEVSMSALTLRMARLADGSINWQKYIRPVPLLPTAPLEEKKSAQPAPTDTSLTNTTNTTAATANATAAASNATLPVATANATIAATTNGSSPVTTDTPPAPSPEALPLSLGIKALAITDSHVIWSDAASSDGKPITIGPIALHAHNIHTAYTKKPGWFSLAVGENGIANDALTQQFLQEVAHTLDKESAKTLANTLAAQTNATLQTNVVNQQNATLQQSAAARQNATQTNSLPEAPNNATQQASSSPIVPTATNGTSSSNSTATLAASNATSQLSSAQPSPQELQPITPIVGAPQKATTTRALAPTAKDKAATLHQQEALMNLATRISKQPKTQVQNATLAAPTAGSNTTVPNVTNATASNKNGTLPTANASLLTSATSASTKNSTKGSTLLLTSNNTNATTLTNNGTRVATQQSNSTSPIVHSKNATQPSGSSAAPKQPQTIIPSALGNIALRGSIQLAPPRIEAQLDVEALPLRLFSAYLQKANVALTKGNFFAHCQLSFYTDPTLSFTVNNGSFGIQELDTSLTLPEATAKIQGKLIEFGGFSYNKSKSHAVIDSALIDSSTLKLSLAPPPKKGKGTPATTTSAPPKKTPSAKGTANNPEYLTCKVATISKSSIEVANPQAKMQFTLGNINFSIDRVSTLPGMQSTLAGKAQWNSGMLSAKGGGTLNPINLHLVTQLDKIPLPSLAPWIQLVSKFDVKQGLLSGETDVTLAEAGVTLKPKNTDATSKTTSSKVTASIGVALSGKFFIDNLLVQEAGEEVIRLRKLRLLGLRANTVSNSYDMTALELDAPHMSFTLYANGLNTITRGMDVTGELAAKAKAQLKQKKGVEDLEKAIEDARKRTETSSTPVSGKPTLSQKVARKSLLPEQRLTIKKISINNGVLKFRDETLPRKASLLVRNIAMTGENISSVSPNGTTFTLSANPEGGNLKMQAKINPLYSPIFGDASLDLQGMDMVPLSPYAEKFLAYPIEKGALSITTKLATDGTVIDSANTIVLGNLTLGNKLQMKNAPNIPIKTGLAILADSNNTITLSLPMVGRLDDPSFRTGNVVAKTFGNIIFKVVASPFSLLGSVIGLGGPDQPDLEYVAFAPGDDRITKSSEKAIEAIISLLKKREKLSVVLEGMADEGEKVHFAAAYIQKGVQVKKWESLRSSEQEAMRSTSIVLTPESNPEEYEKYLFEFYADQPFKKPSILGITKKQPVDVMVQMITASLPSDEMALEQLAINRALAVQEEIQKLAPEVAGRVNIAKGAKIREAATGQNLFSRVELTVK